MASLCLLTHERLHIAACGIQELARVAEKPARAGVRICTHSSVDAERNCADLQAAPQLETGQ